MAPLVRTVGLARAFRKRGRHVAATGHGLVATLIEDDLLVDLARQGVPVGPLGDREEVNAGSARSRGEPNDTVFDRRG